MMDCNKDEALRCVRIAQEAIAIGNKEHALKFIKIAQRLNHNLSVDVLLAKCEKLDFPSTSSSSDRKCFAGIKKENGSMKSDKSLNGEENYTEENVQVIKQIREENDHYAVLGVEKSCSVDEIRRAYKKLSLKVHPDKNKAPGSEDAFKKVSEAYKCLSDDYSRRHYDQTRLVEEFDVFRFFFGQSDAFGRTHVYWARGMVSCIVMSLTLILIYYKFFM